jgi:hypothetical protein
MNKVAEVETTPPANGGMVLVARRQTIINGKVYPCGALLPAELIGPNQLQAMLSAKLAAWVPANGAHRPAPRDIAPSPAARPRPSVELVAGEDVVSSWLATLKLMAEKCDGDVGRARDLLAANPDAASLYKRAVKSACATEAKRRRVVSISPDKLPVPL